MSPVSTRPAGTKPGTTPAKRKKIRLDFAGTNTFPKIPDGQYHSRVKEITQEDGNEFPYLAWRFEILEEGKLKGACPMPYHTSFAPKALWNLRQLLECLGISVPDGPVDLDIESYIGLEVMIRVENEVWEGKERSKVSDFTPIETTTETTEETEGDGEAVEGEEVEEEVEEDAEVEETAEVVEEEDGKESGAEIREMDKAELKEIVKKHGLKLNLELPKYDKQSKRIAAVTDALEAKGLLKD